MRVLLAGFEKWGAYLSNPSQKIAKKFNGKVISGAKIIGIVLPVNFEKLPIVLGDAIKKYRPNIVITLGLSFRKMDRILIEANAKRKIHPNFPDNLGKWPNNSGKPVFYDVLLGGLGPSVRKTKLPINKIISALKEKNIHSFLSKDAGGHMCEEVLYLGQHFIEKEGIKGISGHLHLPHSPLEARNVKSKKYMSFKKIEEGVKIVVEESIKSLGE